MVFGRGVSLAGRFRGVTRLTFNIITCHNHDIMSYDMLFHDYDIMSKCGLTPPLRSEPASGNTSLPDVDSPRFAENTSGTRNMFIRRLGALWALWDRSEAVLEPSWTSLGSPWGPSWASLGPSWAPLGLSWRSPGALLGPSRAVLGLFWAILAPSWAVLGLSWAILGPSWAFLGLSWGPLGPSWGDLGGLRGRLGRCKDQKCTYAKHVRFPVGI